MSVAIVGAPWARQVAQTKGIVVTTAAEVTGTHKHVYVIEYPWPLPARVLQQYACVEFKCGGLDWWRFPIESLIHAGHSEAVVTAHPVGSDRVYAESQPFSLDGQKGDIRSRLLDPVMELIGVLEQTSPPAVTRHPPFKKPVVLPRVMSKGMWERREGQK